MNYDIVLANFNVRLRSFLDIGSVFSTKENTHDFLRYLFNESAKEVEEDSRNNAPILLMVKEPDKDVYITDYSYFLAKMCMWMHTNNSSTSSYDQVKNYVKNTFGITSVASLLLSRRFLINIIFRDVHNAINVHNRFKNFSDTYYIPIGYRGRDSLIYNYAGLVFNSSVINDIIDEKVRDIIDYYNDLYALEQVYFGSIQYRKYKKNKEVINAYGI